MYQFVIWATYEVAEMLHLSVILILHIDDKEAGNIKRELPNGLSLKQYSLQSVVE